jgi:hypothetical protein
MSPKAGDCAGAFKRTTTGRPIERSTHLSTQVGVCLSDLNMQVRAWPTPRAEDCEQTGGHAGVPDTPTAASGVWATPNQRDWKDTGPTQGNRNSPNLGTQAHAVGLPDQGNRSTSGKHRDWSTPNAMGGGSVSRGGERVNELLLAGQAGASKLRGALSAKWVTQLMGFPDGWLVVGTETR